GSCRHVISVRARPEAAARTAYGALGTAQARTRVLAPSRFHHSERRIAVICVLSCGALTGAAVVEMTKFPLSMPYLVKAVKNKEDFLRRYNEIFKGEANTAQCFASAESRKKSARRYEIYCRFKDTPNDWANEPLRLVIELISSGWCLLASTKLMNDAD